jgi:uncharacterized protein YacL
MLSYAVKEAMTGFVRSLDSVMFVVQNLDMDKMHEEDCRALNEFSSKLRETADVIDGRIPDRKDEGEA